MQSENSDNSQDRIRKATDILQKSWWFGFYLIIAPLIISFLVIIIFTQSGVNLFISLSFSVLTYMFAFLFFYKVYDKYRNIPFFLNKENNLTARIQILFLISIISFIVTPIFYLISPPGTSFALLPLISYAVLYNIVYYYYYFQPIDFFNLEEGTFKHTGNLGLMVKQPYNFIILINYIIHLIFLGFTAFTDLSWLFGLITNLIFYLITVRTTKVQVDNIKTLLKEKKPILKELTSFKQSFVLSIVSLLFIILIQMPFVAIIIFSFLGVQYSSLELISTSFLTMIFVLFYFKSRFYVSVYYTSKLNLFDMPEKVEDSEVKSSLKYIKYQKQNSYVSGILILLITIFSFLLEIPLLNLIILPFLFIILHYEQKSELCPKEYNRFVVILNTIALLITIAFGIIPVILETILLNFLVFSLSLYFILQVFVKYEYFIKEDILVYQNLLAITSFALILYSFFPIAIFEYTAFTSDPLIIFVSNFLLHSLLISITFLISLYILGVRYFYAKSPKLFRRFIVGICFLIELAIFTFINFRYFFVMDFTRFLLAICISSILFPIIFLVFLLINYSLHTFPLVYFLKLSYLSFWILLVDFFLSLLVMSLLSTYFIIIIIDFLISSVFYYYILKFGLKLERVNEVKFKKYVKINSYSITIELLSLFFTIFFTAFQALSLFENIIYSLYLSLALVCLLINLFSKKEIFSEGLYFKINTFILLYSSLIAFYYFLLLTLDTLYVLIIPLMVFNIIFYFPLLYLRKKRTLHNLTSRLLKINSILLSVTISLIPTIRGLELYNFGVYFDLIFLIMTVINFTLYIDFTILTIYYYISKKIKTNEERVGFFLKVQVLITLCIGITTIFYYPFFLLIDTLYCVGLPLIFMFCFFYIPFYYSYKRVVFNIGLFKKLIVFNTIILAGLFTSIPTVISVNLIDLGFVFDFNSFLLNIINFSTYIFYIFLLILNSLLKKFEIIKQKYILVLNRLRYITIFSISITTIFFYPFLLLYGTYYSVIVSLIALLFSWFFLFYYSYKRLIFNIGLFKKLIVFNTIILAGLFTSIPTVISVNLIDLGFVFDINSFLLNIINFSIYIFYIFLLILNSLLKKFEIKRKYILILNRLRYITIFSISITTIFFYPFLLLYGTYYSVIVPLIALLFSWFILFYYSYKKEYFNLELVKRLTIYNFTGLSSLIISLPTIIGLELNRIGFEANLILLTTITLILLFIFLKISEIISVKIKLKENYIRFFKLSELVSWFLFSLLLSYYIASIFMIELVVTPTNLLILSCSLFLFFILSVYTLRLISSSIPKLSNLIKYQDIIIYGIILSLSSIFTFLSLSTNLFAFIFSGLESSMLIGFFATLFLFFLIVFDNFLEFRLTQVKIICELTAWLIIKIILCIFISSLIEIFAYQFFIINKIFLFSLIFTFLTPLSLSILENSRFISTKNKFLMKKITVIAFAIFLLSLYIEVLYNLTLSIPIFYQNTLLQITSITANLVIFLYYYFLRFNEATEKPSTSKIYKLFFVSSILFVCLLYSNSILIIFLIFFSYTIILSQRSIIPITRFLLYFLLSFVAFIETVIILNYYGVIAGFDIVFIGIFIDIYILTTICVLFFSILLNIKKNNNLEKIALYALISLLTFFTLMIFTNILAIYNITISIFVFLLFMGIFFYRQQDERYKWFTKPCVILFIFDAISFMSYSWLFNNQIFGAYNPILTFTLTMSITGLGFVLLYNSASARFRKKSFYIVLASIVISFPTFIYFIIISSLSMSFGAVVPLIVAINLGVFLFYLCIGIYQWKISWAIWKSGWYIWNILPFVNFLIIYESFTGIDVFTNSLQFGLYNVQGSLIISIIISSLFFLPVMYTKIKKYFFQIIFIIWGESLFLLYWLSLNLFVYNLLLRNLSFILFSVILLMPLFAGFKYWKIVSILWLLLTLINASFLLFYLSSIGIIMGVTISIDILVIGLFLIVYSFFPNIRSIGVVLITAYFITLLGIFFTIYFILYSLILNPLFSVNISFIVVGFSLFSSKYVKLSKRIIDLCLSWILIFNFSWLTFNTFSLFPGLIIFAFSLALTVFGCSFFIFNRYKMKTNINIVIPYSIITIGASLSVTSLTSIIFKASPGILISTFSSVFILFLYFLITEYRYILWFGFPIPITSPILELLLRFNVIQPFWFLTWTMLYLITFQILINMFKNYIKEDIQNSSKEEKLDSIKEETRDSVKEENPNSLKDEKQKTKNSLFKIYEDKNQLKWFNFTCFLLNSICISLFISIIFPYLIKQILFTQFIFIYQICDFLIIWPILFLFCVMYVEKSELDIKIKDLLIYFNKISIVLYILIPLASGINLLLYLFLINKDLLIIIYSFLLLGSGMAFIEGYLIDRHYFYFLLNSTRNKFTLWSWLIFSNTFAFFFYVLYSNIFFLVLTISILNIISVHFLSYLDVGKPKISTYRVILIYNSFIWSSFYLASLISEGLLILFEGLNEFTYYSMLFQNSFLFLYIFSHFFIKFEKILKNWVELILFITFQGLLAINLILILTLFTPLNFLIVNLIILVEVCLMFNSIKLLNNILSEQKYPNFLDKMYSILVLLLYCEVSLMVYGLTFEVIGIFESILSSLSILLILTLFDIYSIKKIKRSYATFVHTISFFTISIMLLLILNQFVNQYPFLLSLEFFIFLIMQFYTNFSLFNSLKLFYQNKVDILEKLQSSIQRILGTAFYAMLCFFILQSLNLQRIEFQLILLILSIVIHVLMIIDNSLLKFIGKATSYAKLISWIFIMTFTSTYLIWIYNIYFISFFFTVIPIIIIILILELAYLFRLLSFWQLISSNKEKIRFNLILASYVNFITWPLYFSSLNPFLILNLFLASFFIMLLITLIDNILKEKFRKLLRSYSFLIIGGLMSIDLYILLDTIPNFNIFLNLSISSLIFVIFLIILVKPFKEHSGVAFIFWIITFFLLSSIIYYVSLSFIFSGVIFGLLFLVYPFVFLLEELRELFNKFIDIIAKLFKKLKTLIKTIFIKISNFIKTHFRLIWIIINLFISIFLGVLFSPNEYIGLNLLNPIHSTLLIFPLFGLLCSLIPSKKSDDADIRFKRRIFRLVISWGSIIILLFAFITPVWYVFTIWISIWIVGAILLPYMIFKEKRENISIKWRFYTLILLIILLVLFGIIFGFQVYVNFNT